MCKLGTFRLAAWLPAALTAALFAGCGGGGAQLGPQALTLSAAYDRMAQVLTVEVESGGAGAVDLSITAPSWAVLAGGAHRMLPGGSGQLRIDVALLPADQDSGVLAVAATDAYGAKATASALLARPLYIRDLRVERLNVANAEMLLVEADADLAEDAQATAAIEVPDGFNAVGETAKAVTGADSAPFTLELDGRYRLVPLPQPALATVTLTDALGHTDTEQVALDIPPRELPLAPPGNLAVVPLRTYARIGEPVPVAVLTGGLSPGAALHSCWIAVSAPDQAWLVDGSVDPGIPGGAPDYPDGAWERMDPPAATLDLGPADASYYTYYQYWRNLIWFKCTPVGGGGFTAAGTLFTFELEFNREGTYSLWIAKLAYNRTADYKPELVTYYLDQSGVQHEWATADEYEGLAKSIVIVN